MLHLCHQVKPPYQKYSMFFQLFIAAWVLLGDYYFLLALSTLFSKKYPSLVYVVKFCVWSVSLSMLLVIWLNFFVIAPAEPYLLRSFLIRYLFWFYSWKSVFIVFLGLEDFKRLSLWLLRKPTPASITPATPALSRAAFLSQAALTVGAVSFSTLSFGILRGLAHYEVRKVKLYLPFLPDAFHGLRIGQFSDVHVGSYGQRADVLAGIELILNEKTDLIFFTGDMVNYRTAEIEPFFDIFKKLNAPLGMFSVLGNHDYGGYGRWKSEAAYQKNFKDMLALHKALNFDLLQDEHRILELDKAQIAILGVNNWGIRKSHPKLGDIEKASRGTEQFPTKLLLSHDPSHWDEKVRPLCPSVNAMFAGHTHGMQAGVEFGDFQWSPIQYIYPQWAGLYQKGKQQLYVNRGFGVSDIFPGRVGIPAEITVFELLRNG